MVDDAAVNVEDGVENFEECREISMEMATEELAASEAEEDGTMGSTAAIGFTDANGS